MHKKFYYAKSKFAQNFSEFKFYVTTCTYPFKTKEKTAQKQHERVQEEDDNFTEISNNIHGDMLSENPDVAQSAFGPHRVVPDRWKGMSPQQVEDVRRTQEMQREEKEVGRVHLINILVILVNIQ